MRDHDLRRVERDPDSASDLELLQLAQARVRAGLCASCGNEPVSPMSDFKAKLEGDMEVPICRNCAGDFLRTLLTCRACYLTGVGRIRECVSCGARGCGHEILPDPEDFYGDGSRYCKPCIFERPSNPLPPPSESSIFDPFNFGDDIPF